MFPANEGFNPLKGANQEICKTFHLQKRANLHPGIPFAGGRPSMDTLARTAVSPLEIPVGILTSLIGGIFFLLLMRSSHHQAL